jgi:N-acylneuraminate cytidylyltransferase
MLKNLAIIPARGGSKRIPRKNIKPFLGKPIIAYSILAALMSGLFDEVMVSTDDEEIAAIAKEYGAVVPFMRSATNADDHATTTDVLLEVIRAYKEMGREFENACCIYPGAPFTTAAKLAEAYELMGQRNADSVFPVMPFSFPIQRALKVDDSGMQFFYPEFTNTRSQDLEQAYHDAGQFYFFKTAVLQDKGSIFTPSTYPLIISEMEAQDIDNETDWQLAELKYKLLHGE